MIIPVIVSNQTQQLQLIERQEDKFYPRLFDDVSVAPLKTGLISNPD